MRRLILAIALAVSLGGCATIQTLISAASIATASVTNPVTPERLYEVENGMIVAVAALNAYKKSCLAGAADVNCRANIRAIQAYTRRIPPLLAQARAFVRSGDQVNAVVVYNQILALVANFRSTAAAAGVQIGN